jgi:hypothetical protein
MFMTGQHNLTLADALARPEFHKKAGRLSPSVREVVVNPLSPDGRQNIHANWASKAPSLADHRANRHFSTVVSAGAETLAD